MLKKIILLSLFIGGSCAAHAFVVPMMIGKRPPTISWLINALQEDPHCYTQPLDNRLLLHGPPGNGKTTYAHIIAQETNSKLFWLNPKTLAALIMGGGALGIQKIFEAAHAYTQQTNTRAIIFIDGIDTLADAIKDEYAQEYKAATRQLLIEVENSTNKNNLFIIFAVNDRSSLEHMLLEYFDENAVHISNPNKKMRSYLLEYYFKKNHIVIPFAYIKKLTKKTNNLSIDCLRVFAKKVAIILDMQNKDTPTEALLLNTLKEVKKDYARRAPTINIENALQATKMVFSIIAGVASTIVTLMAQSSDEK